MSTYKYGSSGSGVKTWQHSLNLEDPSLGLPETGNFLTLTQAATKKFQKKYGLEDDGIAGPLSQAKMAVILSGHIPPVEEPKGNVLILDIYAGNNVTSFLDAKRGGCEAIIHKASQGSSKKDSLIRSRWKQIKDAGMIPGAYLFFEPSANWRTQYENFKSVCADLQGDGDMPWSLDYGEYDLSPSQANRDGALEILRAMEKDSGFIPLCYGATGLLGQYNLQVEFARYSPWLANFSGRDKPPAVDPWGSRWVIYQYAESKSGEIPGMGAGADINKFNGSLEQLKKFIENSKVGAKPDKPVEENPIEVETPVTPPVYWKAHKFHPRFDLPKPYTHLQPIDVLRSVTGEKEIAGSKDNPLIAHFHEHSPNLGTHSEGADYHDEVPHCRSGMNWASDGAGCEKSGTALASDVSGTPVAGDWVEEGDEIHIKHPGNHVTFANKRFNRRTVSTFEGFGSNQSNSIRMSFYPTSTIQHVNRPKPLPGTVLAPIGILGAKPQRSDTENA